MFLEGLKATLTADVKFQGGWYRQDDPPVAGLRAFARVYAGWGFSQQFYWLKVCVLSEAQLFGGAPLHTLLKMSTLNRGLQ